MTQALFSSLDGADALTAAAIDLTGIARDLAAARAGTVEVLAFAPALFDPAMAEALTAVATQGGRTVVRILTDWSDSLRGSRSVLPGVDDLGHPAIRIRYTLDLPYRRDPVTGHPVHAPQASLGRLRHRALLVTLDGVAVAMAVGSFGLPVNATPAYRSLLLLGDEPADAEAMADFLCEFRAMWSDPRLSAPGANCAAIAGRARAALRAGIDLRAPGQVARLLGQPDTPAADARNRGAARTPATGPVLAAFTGSQPTGRPRAGHAPLLADRVIDHAAPGAGPGPVPLVPGALAIHALRGLPAAARVLIARPGLGPRSSETAEVVAAAARGVQVSLLIDVRAGAADMTVLRTAAAAHSGHLVIGQADLRLAQSYVASPDTGMVLVGTGDGMAAPRDSDHAILWRSHRPLAASFAADFAVMQAAARSLAQPVDPPAAA